VDLPGSLRGLVSPRWNRSFEAQIFETKPLLPHIDATIQHVKELAHEEALPVPLALVTAQARVDTVPKGAVLIIGAWNYPAQLTIGPLVDCIGAGNTAVLKPSEVSPNSASVVGDLVSRYIEDDAVTVVQGAVKETTRLLEKRWDHIVYTGNSMVGRIVMAAAAKHLTPVTLELGGKCPVIVDKTADLAVACKRIVQARFVNAGQTCLAADYVLVEEAVHDRLVSQLKRTIVDFYGSDFKASVDYPRIINERHTKRIAEILDEAKELGATVECGGEVDVSDHYIAPTVISHCPPEARLQKEEIFGPLLLVQSVPDVDAAIERVNAGEKPLALYVFSSDAVSRGSLVVMHGCDGSWFAAEH
jgi:aldehyde dehydrogenase (NAD+)